MDDDLQLEIERRFIVKDTSIVESCGWNLITQAYIFSIDDFAVRVRIKQTPDEDGSGKLVDTAAELTVKGPRTGVTREEYPLLLPMGIARNIIERSANVVVKRRYQFLEEPDLTWEVDEFLGANAGLWVAEIESSTTSAISSVRKPTWASIEVTTDRDYNNENLAVRPYTTWERNNESPYDEG